VAEAAKVCFDHGASITFANEKPPPLYLCIECANEIHRCSANLSFHDVIHPMQQVRRILHPPILHTRLKYVFGLGCFVLREQELSLVGQAGGVGLLLHGVRLLQHQPPHQTLPLVPPVQAQQPQGL
jgi:hypothetical protein